MAESKLFLSMYPALLLVVLLSALAASTAATAVSPPGLPPGCGEETGACHNRAEAFKLKVIAFVAILITSMIGVCSPLLSRSVPGLQPDTNLFVLVKAFASGVILATGYMHVMPDSFNDLTSPCLPDKPWRKFPFTTFVAMLSALVTLMIDSFTLSSYKKRTKKLDDDDDGLATNEMVESQDFGRKQDGCHHGHGLVVDATTSASQQLIRYRVIAQVLEIGIVVHSVVIGLSLGTSENPCTIRPLVAALCFHQMFEGMGLGGCILQAEYGLRTKAIMAFFFSFTTPFGIAMGFGLSKVYSPNSPTALIVVGLLNASSAGLLNYMALVDLLASDFMAEKLQNSRRLQSWAYLSVLLGAGGMSVMALWA